MDSMTSKPDCMVSVREQFGLDLDLKLSLIHI